MKLKFVAWRVLLSLVLVGGVVRLLPFVFPIRTADIQQEQQAVQFSDRNGLPLGTLLTRDQEHTAVISLQQVSPHFIQAILAAEDGRFYHHGPLELRAIARSVRDSLQAGEVISGASTITMQLARMLQPAPRTLEGKIQEIWNAWRLAAGMNKDQILEAYINRLPMGGNVYGIEAAARVYFGTSAQDLTLAQSSLLAALPNDPTRLHPHANLPGLRQRQGYVLSRMIKDGYLTPTQAQQALHSPIALLPNANQGIKSAPHFLFWAARQLPVEHPSQIRTTLDLSLQEFVEAQVRQTVQGLRQHQGHHAAALVIHNGTGEVLAYVGSPDYFTLESGRNDGVQALRQPGSTLKPFLYQLALEQRLIQPNTVLADIPTYYAIPGAQLYNPTDYSKTFLGPVRVRVALANSLNVPAVRVLEQVGVGKFLDRLHQLGFAHLRHPPEYYGLGLALGSGEVSLWQLTQAYVTLARQGRAIPLQSLLPAPTNTHSQLQLKSPAPAAIASPASWSLIRDMLSDTHARAKAFGVDSMLDLPFPAAVKTGTSSNYRDTWTVGFTPEYTVATWVGNFDGQPMRQVSGVTGAAPLWNRIMLHLYEHRQPTGFDPPKDLILKPVCALSGMRPTGACPAVVQEYFYPEDLENYNRNPDTFYQAVPADPRSPNSNPSSSPRYRLNLPPEYNQWLATQPTELQGAEMSSSPAPAAQPGTLKILFPRDDDYFLLPAAETPSGQQRLEFKLANLTGQPAEWHINGQRLPVESAIAKSTTSVYWPLRPGTWTLQVRSGEVVDQVRFQVQQSDRNTPQDTKRGFSVQSSR
jgi:penicillin-binding protein 1C